MTLNQQGIPRIRGFAAVLLAGAVAAAPAAVHAARPLQVDDFLRVQSVESPVCAADGRWLAYTVTQTDREADEHRTSLWMVDWEGTRRLRLAGPAASLSAPAFSPDGRFVSYLAAQGAEGKAQILVLDRQGGEAQALTAVTGDIGEYQWAPDGKRIVLSLVPGDEAAAGTAHAAAPAKAAPPIVIDALHFKEDRKGYLTAGDHAQLFLLDVASHGLTPLTQDTRYDDTAPAWSPDGRRIAFVSTRDSDPGRTGQQELYVIDAQAGAVPRKLAAFGAPNRQALQWTADGASVLLQVGQEARRSAYAQDRLAAVDAGSGALRILTDALDRPVSHVVPGPRPGTAGLLVEDDGTQYPAVVQLDTGAVARALPAAPLLVTDQCSAAGHTAVVAATDSTAPEIHALEAGRLRRLSTHNDALMAEIVLGAVEDFAFRGADGATVHGLLTLPVGYQPGTRYPTVLWIHGGPNGQDGHGLDFSGYPLALERQLFAAHGYAVLAVNYHGSSARGAAFAESILGDWGHKEVIDLLGAVDYAVQERQVADPQRLGIGGWSYGGILTDYAIAADTRFKAGISGAGSANQLTMYGSDQYILQYNAELGAPWKNEKLWLQLSYPFFHADRIRTPTLYMGGEKDFNVPIAGGEQMYEALRTLGVATQLVVYPGQFHIFDRPSYIKDRAQRYLAWYDRYLKPAAPVPAR